MIMTQEKIQKIADMFQIRGRFKSFEQIKSGNINTTYKVIFFRDNEDKTYIIQRVNTYVFKNPEQVMDNIARVTEHIRSGIKATGRSAKRYVLHYLYTIEGNNFAYDEDGGFWRGYRFVDNSVCYDSTDNLKILEGAGHAFGDFQRYLADFDATTLHESIPDFHNTKKRFDTLFRMAIEFNGPRVEETKEELDYLKSIYELSSSLCTMLDNGSVPLRVTHNDTKCNNVLFDADDDEPLAVIDLDTVMPGLAMYDFGDAIRFSANAVDEDCPEYDKVSLDLAKFEAFTKGFITSLGGSLTIREMETMALGSFVMTAELAARFLLDYIMGDKYFKLNYPEHNLVRTRSQIALCKDMYKKLDDMNDIVMKYE
ncbi:MAG: aminoglycoside phosphotransferase family protein [Clostridia bacterium]|nr:aminoglycoside phosphotransferase family protein [Clostridia bacterium]